MIGAARKCAKCEKLVYPVEELKCLDKVWHKLCFKCTTCGMVLNMKNYKGFDKQPYCATHYPQQKHTVVTDNLEMQRIKENTKIQSNAKYHEDFEKSKGNYTVLADDPETRRVLENSKIISQVKYHEDFEKSKNKYTHVADNLETTRALENQKIISGIEYKGHNKSKEPFQGIKTSSSNDNNITINNSRYSNDNFNINNITTAVTYSGGIKQTDSSQNMSKRIGSIADYDPFSNERVNVPSKSAVDNNGSNIGNRETLTNDTTKVNLPSSNTSIFRAVYDYDAEDDDEISFRYGDRFYDAQLVDVGWMVGTHENSKKYGFFPSNYVEPVETL